MKEKLVRLTKPLLLACVALDIWITIDLPSILLFGEYEPPKKPEED